MNLIENCTKTEIDLIKKAGIIIENKDYTREELKKCETEIIEYIMSQSSKNGNISNLRNQYENIFSKISIK